MVDQFKTQIMFLHPEPSMMEPCARKLGDEYSVHMAASGTEALTTLGITPIDIIISAQDLPGMSGQEALKEAKKRSPETRGILLASARMSEADRAALVSVRHLNRILKAESSVDEICAAIQQELHPHLAESLPQPANDHSAGPRHSASSPNVDTMSQTGAFNILKDDIPVLEPGAAAPAPAAQSTSQVEIVVLTNDASFLKTIRAATGSSHVVNHAPNLQEAVDVVREGRSGVLITDAAVAVRDVQTITAKLRKHMPSLVTIVAGRREDGEKMMGLISDGLVYRFLLKPISPGRSRLAIEASAKKHLTLVNTEVPLSPEEVQQKMTETGIIKGVTFDSGLFRTTDVRQSNINLPSLDDDDVGGGLIEKLAGRFGMIGVAVAAVVVIGILAAVFMGGDDEPTANTVNERTATQPASATLPAQRQPTTAERIDALLARADQALAEGRLVAPADDNAVIYYAQATALKRDDQQLRATLESVLQRVFTQIEGDLLQDNLNGARASLNVVNATVPGHPRLAFFNRQINKEIARRDLASIETAINAGNIDGARATLTRLENSGIVDGAIIDTLQARLQSAEESSATSSADLLEIAAQRVAANQLVAPANDSARYYYRAVLDIEPDNTVARQGMTFVASILLSDARTALARSDWDNAEVLLNEAAASGANNIEVTALRRELASAQPAANAQTPAGSSDESSAASVPATAPVEAPASGSPDGIVETRQAGASPRTAEQNIGSDIAAETPPPVPAAISANIGNTPTAAASTPTAQEFDLQQTVYEPPRYPRTAQRRGIEGWADVEFIVRADGVTDEVRVADSEPGEIFDSAAIEAVSKWRYEPLQTDDPQAFSRARIRLEFNLRE